MATEAEDQLQRLADALRDEIAAMRRRHEEKDHTINYQLSQLATMGKDVAFHKQRHMDLLKWLREKDQALWQRALRELSLG